MNLHYCPSSSNNVGIPVSRTYRVGIVSDNRSVTYPRLSFLFPSLSFVSSTRNIFFLLATDYRSPPYSTIPIRRRGTAMHGDAPRHFIHENNPVTGVTASVNPFSYLVHEITGVLDSMRVKMIFHFFVSAYLINVTRTSLIRSDTCNCPLPFPPPCV